MNYCRLATLVVIHIDLKRNMTLSYNLFDKFKLSIYFQPTLKRPIHAEVCRKAERPAGNSEGNSRVRSAPMRAPYTQRFARGSGQKWHFVSLAPLACQKNFKQWREGDGPRVQAKPGGRINHTHTKVCLAASETRGFTSHNPVRVWAPLWIKSITKWTGGAVEIR
jgi:hypothetical protein